MWNFAIDTQVLDEAKQFEGTGESKFIKEPGVYKVTISEFGVYKANSGADMIHFKGITEDNKELTLNWFLRKADGTATFTNKNGKQVPFPGVVNTDKIIEIATNGAKRINNIMPMQGQYKIFGQDKPVFIFMDTIGKQVVIGVRLEKDEEFGDKLVVADAVDPNDQEKIQKLKERIDKKPEVTSKPKQTTSTQQSSSEQSVEDLF